MNDNTFDLITIGESLIEFSTNQKLKDAECLHKYYGGDSLVVAIAAKRLNSNVGFITCLGDDPFKDFLLSSWEKEGLDTRHVKIVDAKNGIYMVSRTAVHDKEFIYFRKKIAPAKLSVEDIDEDYIKSSKIVYASGVTQSLSLASREAVKKTFELARENNILTAYDPNYSPLISSPEDAREYFDEISPLTDILFMSAKYDTKSIFEVASLENIIKYLNDQGIQIIVIKSSDDKGYFISNQGNINYKRKQSIVVKGLKELGWPIDDTKLPHSTFYLWLPIPRKYKESYKFCEDLLEKSGIVIVPGSAFGKYGEGFFRLSCVCSDEKLKEVIERMKADGFKY